MKLDLIRSRIDEIDSQVAELLSERLGLTGEIAAIKSELNLPVKDEQREESVYKRVLERAKTKAQETAIRRIYERVLDQSRQMQISEWQPERAQDQSQTSYFPSVAILGMGLIGSAMARQIRNCHPKTKLAGVDREDVLSEALKLGLIDTGTTDLAAAVRGTSLIILAAPPKTNLELLKEVAPLLKKRMLVLDVSSTKSQICDLAEKLNLSGADFIGGHPLFGSEKSGPHAAMELSIDDRVFCLVKTQKSSEMAVRRLVKWLASLNLSADISSAREHDQVLASTSHLLQLIAIALGAELVSDKSNEDLTRLAKLCGPSMRQLARLMKSPVAMWQEIVQQNSDQIRLAINGLQGKLNDIVAAMDNSSSDTLSGMFEKAKRLADALEHQK